MQPNPEVLLENMGLELPLIGLYDAPDPTPFEPLVALREGRWACVFMYYKRWLRGETVHLKEDNYGCSGAGDYLFDQQTRSREDYIDFLYGDEGLKASKELMGSWIDHSAHYQPKNPNLFLGPLKAAQYEHLISITFLVNPDQLSLLLTGANYHQAPGDAPSVLAPFASGCGLIAPLFDDLEAPQAIIGATDIAMRKYLPPEIMAFTVTRPMFEQLCALDENSFLYKPFWRDLQKARKRLES